jgi:hypothetical protein
MLFAIGMGTLEALMMMRFPRVVAIVSLIMMLSATLADAQAPVAPGYLGFDRNDYPGDDNLILLRRTFTYTGYWLNNPPGAKTNSWAGKRSKVEAAGLGFLVLFNGRLHSELQSATHAAQLGEADARAAGNAARQEGFPDATVIFLDQEEGGRLLPEQKAYLFAWVDGVIQTGYRAGVYCSGIAAKEASGESIVTAADIRRNAGSRTIVFWIANDACPPSPGCTIPARLPSPTSSDIPFADVWQFAQSPRRNEVASRCRGYDKDGNCYPGTDSRLRLHLDMNVAASPDPSHGRSR